MQTIFANCAVDEDFVKIALPFQGNTLQTCFGFFSSINMLNLHDVTRNSTGKL